MINGGNATIYVSDINASIRFYTETLGLTLRMRAADHWAEIDAGPGLIIGLHPANSPHSPKPGTVGSISVGLNVTQPLEDVVRTLVERGVEFHGPIMEDTNVRLAFFADPDGNPMYLAQVMYAGAHGT